MAAPGHRARRGSQLAGAVRYRDHRRRQRRATAPGEDHNCLAASGSSKVGTAAPGHRARRGSQRRPRRRLADRPGRSAGPPRPARITTRDPPGRLRRDRRAAPGHRARRGSQLYCVPAAGEGHAGAAPGHRARRGSQLDHGRRRNVPGSQQRRATAPGEDHNWACWPPTRRCAPSSAGPPRPARITTHPAASRYPRCGLRQRRATAPGEDHNTFAQARQPSWIV